jgi:hypothetical protein
MTLALPHSVQRGRFSRHVDDALASRDEAAICPWLESAATKSRGDRLMDGYLHWIKRFAGKPPSYPGTAYVLLHSLSHALMAEIALDCGYPASSLEERVYSLSSPEDGADRYGILIYTATAGAQGTLGGLVGTAPRFASILQSAHRRKLLGAIALLRDAANAKAPAPAASSTQSRAAPSASDGAIPSPVAETVGEPPPPLRQCANGVAHFECHQHGLEGRVTIGIEDR